MKHQHILQIPMNNKLFINSNSDFFSCSYSQIYRFATLHILWIAVSINFLVVQLKVYISKTKFRICSYNLHKKARSTNSKPGLESATPQCRDNDAFDAQAPSKNNCYITIELKIWNPKFSAKFGSILKSILKMCHWPSNIGRT